MRSERRQSTLRPAPSMLRVALCIVELLPALLFGAVYFRRAESVSWRPWVLFANGNSQLKFTAFGDGGRTLELESWGYDSDDDTRNMDRHGWHRIDQKSRAALETTPLREATMWSQTSSDEPRHDGPLVASWDANQVSSSIQLWDVSDGWRARRALRRFNALTNLRDVASAPDSRQVAIASGNRCEVRDARTGSLRLTLRTGEARHIAWSPDGATIATVDSALRLWDTRDGRPLAKAWLGTAAYNSSPPAFSLDSKLLAVIDGKRDLQLRDARSGLLRHRIRHGALGGAILFSPDGAFLACGENPAGTGRRTHIFDVQGAVLKRTLHTPGFDLNPEAWSPDSAHLVTRAALNGYNGHDALIMWRIQGWYPPAPFSTGAPPRVKPGGSASNTVTRGY